ncbi:protein-tyrosine sulfotransferase 2 [Plakobranchus ocellatus]|uniref:Protein-tyrosine sulfotransferase n=1 Tax=Plakobranchus ocellatus TaxID=259542 RepID=A0AAV3ZHU7_9GAST|nr:protein-tyrosine sulfotransferase 2 [Plakobranchus ocellatus]
MGNRQGSNNILMRLTENKIEWRNMIANDCSRQVESTRFDSFAGRQTQAMGFCRQMGRPKLYLITLGLLFTLYVLYSFFPCDPGPRVVMVPRESTKYIYAPTNHSETRGKGANQLQAIPYDDQSPLIFVGGMPRSGTTLMRAMLDAHPDIRCGEETRVIPRILGIRMQWSRSPLEKKRLDEAGVTDQVIDSAVKAFILEIIAKHGEAAPHLCNKDPFTLKSTFYLTRLFPNAKFILMIRDGRAVVHSIITRQVTISGFDLKSYRASLAKWNNALEVMYSQCLRVGQSKCLPVYYEQLTLHPKEWMVRILKFLDIPWNESVLHHEQFIDKPGGIAISKVEKSTGQVIKPVNSAALSTWVGNIPIDVVKDMEHIAPMLRTLGYDPNANPPNYGQPDPAVADNTIHIKKNADFYRKREQELLHPEQQQQQQQQQQKPSESGEAGDSGRRR